MNTKQVKTTLHDLLTMFTTAEELNTFYRNPDLTPDIKTHLEKELERYPVKLLNKIEADLNGIKKVIKQAYLVNLMTDFSKQFKELYYDMIITGGGVWVYLGIDDIKKDMLAPIKWLGDRDLVIDDFFEIPESNQIRWMFKDSGLIIYAMFRNTICSYVQKGTKTVPNMVLECGKIKNKIKETITND